LFKLKKQTKYIHLEKQEHTMEL